MATDSLLPEEFDPTDLVKRRNMTVTSPPGRLCVDPSSNFYHAAKLERGRWLERGCYDTSYARNVPTRPC
jgi:hypothetical protein